MGWNQRSIGPPLSSLCIGNPGNISWLWLRRGTHTVAALARQLPWNLGGVSEETTCRGLVHLAALLCTGSSRLLLRLSLSAGAGGYRGVRVGLDGGVAWHGPRPHCHGNSSKTRRSLANVLSQEMCRFKAHLARVRKGARRGGHSRYAPATPGGILSSRLVMRRDIATLSTEHQESAPSPSEHDGEPLKFGAHGVGRLRTEHNAVW